ncbi:MAG: SPFH domain-containing protein [Phycisphaeraceae bacterium]
MSQAPPDPISNKPTDEPGLDAAQQSLSDALSVSFRVLKILMVFLTVFYLLSGTIRVQEGETAVSYRLGKEVGTYQSGWHFGLPFPIQRNITVPSNTQTLRLDESFWYNNPDDKKPEELAFQQLNPLNDSFLITGDTNVIHVQFGINYVIDPDRVDDYLRNVGTIERANELVKTAAERGMIHYVASANVENIITRGKFENTVIQANTQKVLTDLETGIKIQQVLIEGNNQSMPNQVREAYNAVTQAQAEKARTIQEARRVYNQTLGETAGGAHTDLLSMIRAYEWALASEDNTLTKQLRDVLDASFRELRLPSSETLAAITAYQQASANAAGNDDAQAKEEADIATAALAKQLTDHSDAFTGRAIAGQIAAAISEASAMRYQISNKAEQDYNRYASDLATYNKTPRLLASTRLQETREKVLSDVLVQTIVGPITRINTNPDPEVAEEIAEADLIRRREEARRKKEAQGR